MNAINTLYVMKIHTLAAYAACTITVRGYSEALYEYFSRMADQDRRHAAALYGFLLGGTPDDQPETEVFTKLPCFRAFQPGAVDGGGEQIEVIARATVMHLFDAARAEKAFYKLADAICQKDENLTAALGETISLAGLAGVSVKRERELAEWLKLVETNDLHGYPVPHECAFCGHIMPGWDETCPVCHQQYQFQERIGGYLHRPGKAQ